MKESLFIGAYWNAREEQLDDCSEKIVDFLTQLSDFLDVQHWELRKRKKSIKKQIIELNKDYIASTLNTNKRDDNNSPIRELGFNLGIWNGANDFPIIISITCGAFSQFVKNTIILRFPPAELNEILPRLDFYQKLISIFIEVWNPDNVLLTSNEYMSRNEVDVFSKEGGWLVYSKGKPIIRNDK